MRPTCSATRLVFVSLFVITSLGSRSSAAAQPPETTGRPLLDQFNAEVLSSSINGGASAYEWQQGITAGIAGQLTRIALYVVISESAGEVVPTELSVRLGAPWQTGGAVWTTTTTVRKSGWNTFDVSKAKIFVEIGDEYSIGIHGQSQSNFNPGFGISYGDEYLGGDLFLNGTTAGSEGNDLLFRTYVSAKRGQRK